MSWWADRRFQARWADRGFQVRFLPLSLTIVLVGDSLLYFVPRLHLDCVLRRGVYKEGEG